MDENTPRLRHPDPLGQAFLWALLPMLVLFLVAPSVGDTQEVTTSITSTTGAGNLGTTITHAGNLYNITGGTRPGEHAYLFHSFGDFSVGSGDIANFLNDTGVTTFNIIGRVTGGNISNIYGTIQTTGFDVGGSPTNLFLVNPSGFVFGPNGSVDVGGSVSFTTAQYLRLFDSLNGVSANFYANPANDGLANSVLAVAPVVDFGFLSPAAYGFLTAPDPSAAITLQGNTLSVAPSGDPGSAISLIGGKVVIQGASLPDGTVQPARLLAPNRTIQIATTASPGEFDMATLQALPNVGEATFTSSASVTLAPGSSLDVGGGSSVFIIGGQLVYSINDATLKTTDPDLPAPPDTILLSPGSAIVTQTSGREPGADVQIRVGTLQIDGTAVYTIQSGDGPGGNIDINATTVSLTNSATVLSLTGFDFTTGALVGSGNGGNVTVQGLQGAGSAADSVVLSNGSAISTLTFGSGRAGDVQLSARFLTMENFSSIQTVTLGGVGGNVALNVGTLRLMEGASIQTLSQSFTPEFDRGGNVTIQGLQGAGSAAESVTLSGGSSLLSQTNGSGDGGRVAIMSKTLMMDGAGTTVNTTASDVGHGGDIVLSVGQARLSRGATIITQTNSADLNALEGGTVTVQGWQGVGSKADSVALSGFGSGIVSDTLGVGRSGDVAVHAKTVSLTDGAVIQAGTPSTTAAGGNVTIDADSVGISGGSHISSQSVALDAGQVTITANTLSLNNGSIDTSTSSENGGSGGDVVLYGGNVSLTNGASITTQNGVFSTGRAGDVTMTVGSLTLANGANITSSSKGIVADAGDAGKVTIMASGPFTSDASTIVTSALNAKGGDIKVTAQSVALSNGAVMSASSQSPPLPDEGGDAGSITIHSGSTVVMHNSVMTAEASQASGGQVTIITPEMLWLTNSRISTSVFGDNFASSGGNITIDPQFVILQNSQIIASAFFGLSGALDITAGVFLADPASLVEASSTLSINTPTSIPVGGLLTPLSQEFSSAAALLLAQRCAADPTGQFSSFVQTGRDGVPQVPGALSPSPLSFLETLTSGSLGSQSPNLAAARLGLDRVSFNGSTRFHLACRS